MYELRIALSELVLRDTYVVLEPGPDRTAAFCEHPIHHFRLVPPYAGRRPRRLRKNALTGAFLGTIPINTGGHPSGGLWALEFGTGGSNGSPNTLFFNDGINREMDGLFGDITAVPGPIVGAGLPGLIAAASGLMVWWRRRRSYGF